jgi:hypothetical protein
MSSDPSQRQDRFRLTAAVTIGALLLAALGLTVANARQGPRLLDAQINPAAAVEGAGERLIMRVDQTVAEPTAAQVTVTPTVPIEPTTDGAALIVRFADSLSYATTYEIVAKVQSGTTGASATLTYSFRTPDGAFYTLKRAASSADTDAPDQIVHHFLGSTEQRIVRSQPRIEQYAVADPVIAVVTSDAAGAGALTVGPLDGSEPSQTLANNSDGRQTSSNCCHSAARGDTSPGWQRKKGASSVVMINNGNVRQIYAEDPDPVGGIQKVCLSPNGQYLAVAKLPRDTATNPDSSGFANRTEFVDTATGRTDHDVVGSEVNWCN